MNAQESFVDRISVDQNKSDRMSLTAAVRSSDSKIFHNIKGESSFFLIFFFEKFSNNRVYQQNQSILFFRKPDFKRKRNACTTTILHQH